MTDLSELLSTEDLEHVRPRSHPSWVQPTLATLTHDHFSDPAWLYERKLDGERCLAFRDGDSVRVLTRNRKDVSDTYPELVDALAAQDVADVVLDGEVVAFEGPQTSFARLQGRLQLSDPKRARASGIEVFYYVFDLLHRDGYDLTGLGLRTRKKVLRRTLRFADPLRFSDHRVEHGEAMYREACRKGWEGVIAKRGDGSYHHGRSTDWLKFKCVRDQELVIGGYTEPQGSRHGLGALLVGYHDHGGLRYAGKVGTGFTAKVLAQLHDELSRISTDTSPFTDAQDVPRRGVHWVRPRTVAQIGFTEWTEAGRLRHPRYQGLRRDKDARDVVREQT